VPSSLQGRTPSGICVDSTPNSPVNSSMLSVTGDPCALRGNYSRQACTRGARGGACGIAGTRHPGPAPAHRTSARHRSAPVQRNVRRARHYLADAFPPDGARQTGADPWRQRTDEEVG
jgi:hypothetical protein